MTKSLFSQGTIQPGLALALLATLAAGGCSPDRFASSSAEPAAVSSGPGGASDSAGDSGASLVASIQFWGRSNGTFQLSGDGQHAHVWWTRGLTYSAWCPSFYSYRCPSPFAVEGRPGSTGLKFTPTSYMGVSIPGLAPASTEKGFTLFLVGRNPTAVARAASAPVELGPNQRFLGLVENPLLQGTRPDGEPFTVRPGLRLTELHPGRAGSGGWEVQSLTVSRPDPASAPQLAGDSTQGLSWRGALTQPQTAAEWSALKLTWSSTLRPDVTFEPGKPIPAVLAGTPMQFLLGNAVTAEQEAASTAELVETLVFQRPLSAVELAGVREYLAEKYDIPLESRSAATSGAQSAAAAAKSQGAIADLLKGLDQSSR